jgi:hypothetical protein
LMPISKLLTTHSVGTCWIECTLVFHSHVFLLPQIYVEIERARLTKRLAKIKEAGGDVNEAADTLQEVAVVRA